MKIVIVDDDILVSSALKTILEAGGEVEVTGTGQDGKDAVRLYDELLPDVLLMDIRMKDMNGLDAAEQILKMTWQVPKMKMEAVLAITVQAMAMKIVRH